MRYPTAGELIRHWFFILPYAGNWSYDYPYSWPDTYPDCGGYRQSPINLESFSREVFEYRDKLEFHNYRKSLTHPVRIINNGYSAEVGIRNNTDGSFPFIRLGNADIWDDYEVRAVHFHWGSAGVKGSEHTIDDERFDLEMHIVHQNEKYDSIEQARDFSDGFVVLAVLFKAVPFYENERFKTLDEIYNALPFITKYNSTADFSGPVSMVSFLPDILHKSEFFSYKGSLTTPPCSEAARFIVFTDVLPITYSDLSNFWNLIDANGNPLINNFRPLQESNRRVFLKHRRLIFL